MKAYELLIMNKSLFVAMDKCAIQASDVKYAKLITEYIAMLNEGYKKTYIVQHLSDEYDIPERTLYRIIERLMKNVPME